eukprot:scaffold21636_cov60-Phaeocystis_antarctica.AAC.3
MSYSSSVESANGTMRDEPPIGRQPAGASARPTHLTRTPLASVGASSSSSTVTSVEPSPVGMRGMPTHE